MAQGERHPPSPQGQRSRQKPVASKAWKHKIIVESFTQEKKKLYSISFETSPPTGYTFVPAGNPALTSQCKELSKEEDTRIYTVTTTPHKNQLTTLSHQVHRIGYHFRNDIVSKACSSLGLYLSRSGKVIDPYYGMSYGLDPQMPDRRQRADSEKSQISLNTEARDAIKDLFPNIPDKDLNTIISTAFQKGTKKVGTAAELPLVRRAQLAVVAHIRHCYTNYDRLLRIGSYADARASVEQKCLQLLVSWRGSDESADPVLEDVLREVIVISDDEDSEDDDDENESMLRRDSSIEIISSSTIAHEVQSRPVDPARLGTSNTEYYSDEEAPSGVRIVPLASSKKRLDPQKSDRRGFARYRRWNEAMSEHRHGATLIDQREPEIYSSPSHIPSHSAMGNLRLEGNLHQAPRQIIPERAVYVDSPGLHSRPAIQYVSSPRHTERSTRYGPPQLRDGEGYELVPVQPGPRFVSGHEPIHIHQKQAPAGHSQSNQVEPSIYAFDKVSDRGVTSNFPRSRRHGSPDSTTGHTILPSIEGPQIVDPLRSAGPTKPRSFDYVFQGEMPQTGERRTVAQTAGDPMNPLETPPRKRQRLGPEHAYPCFDTSNNPLDERHALGPSVSTQLFEEQRPVARNRYPSELAVNNTARPVFTDNPLAVKRGFEPSRDRHHEHDQLLSRTPKGSSLHISKTSYRDTGAQPAQLLPRSVAVPQTSSDVMCKPSYSSNAHDMSHSVPIRPIRVREFGRPLSDMASFGRTSPPVFVSRPSYAGNKVVRSSLPEDQISIHGETRSPLARYDGSGRFHSSVLRTPSTYPTEMPGAATRKVIISDSPSRPYDRPMSSLDHAQSYRVPVTDTMPAFSGRRHERHDSDGRQPTIVQYARDGDPFRRIQYEDRLAGPVFEKGRPYQPHGEVVVLE